MPQKRKPDDASKTLRQPIDEEAARTATIEFEDLRGRISRHLNWRSVNPLKDVDTIGNLLDEIRAQRRREAGGPPVPAKELNMVKDDPIPESNAILMADQPARSPELVALLAAVVDHPERWMSTPSAHFGGRRPIELVGSDEEAKIFDILHAVDQGLF